MQRHYRRLTSEERRTFGPRRPFWRRRRELSEPLVQILHCEVERLWDTNGCGQGCCPDAYLFELRCGAWLAVSSWHHFDFKGEQRPHRQMTIEWLPYSGRVIEVTYAGEPLQFIEHAFRFDGGAECAVLTWEQLGEVLRETIAGMDRFVVTNCPDEPEADQPR